MNLQSVLSKVRFTLSNNSPTILSAVAVGGVVTTAFLASTASIKAYKIVQAEEGISGTAADRKDRWKSRTKLVWKLYIPTAASGAVTIGSIVGSTKIGNKRSAAAQAAFVLTERAYNEYRGKVIEEFGDRKDKAIRDQIAEEKVKNNPPSPLIISGPGNVLCCELYTGRYFTSDMETLRRATNELNARMLKHDVASFQDWYDMIGLPPTTYSDELGWHADRLMELEFTTILTEEGKPCLAFDYNYHRPLYEGIFT